MPTGAPLRADGQSHYEAWQAILRRDPCAYCGAPHAGTVDHIEPRCREARGIGPVHGWINLTAACQRCNGAKRDTDLLLFLVRRQYGHRPCRRRTRTPRC
jgi:5-methylcytosine-specific restriction endonuclease McrA